MSNTHVHKILDIQEDKILKENQVVENNHIIQNLILHVLHLKKKLNLEGIGGFNG